MVNLRNEIPVLIGWYILEKKVGPVVEKFLMVEEKDLEVYQEDQVLEADLEGQGVELEDPDLEVDRKRVDGVIPVLVPHTQNTGGRNQAADLDH